MQILGGSALAVNDWRATKVAQSNPTLPMLFFCTRILDEPYEHHDRDAPHAGPGDVAASTARRAPTKNGPEQLTTEHAANDTRDGVAQRPEVRVLE